MRRYSNKNRGSLTVEACMAFPVFLCFFLLLLFCVKFACVSLTLDLAVNETAKQIAVSAYPIKYLNTLEDDIIEEYGSKQIPTIEEELGKLPEYAGIGDSDDALADILTGNLPQPDIKGMIGKVASDYMDGVVGYYTDKAADVYWEYKSGIKYRIAKALMDNFIHEGLINPQNIRFRLVEFPQSEHEYALRKEQYSKLGFGGADITRDDVVVQVEYRFDIPLPFFDSQDIRMVHTAVEKAWLKGSYGVITERKEGLDIFEAAPSTIVYVTRTGKRYHLGSCRYLYASKIPMPLSQAALKYTPCKVCKPPPRPDN